MKPKSPYLGQLILAQRAQPLRGVRDRLDVLQQLLHVPGGIEFQCGGNEGHRTAADVSHVGVCPLLEEHLEDLGLACLIKVLSEREKKGRARRTVSVSIA